MVASTALVLVLTTASNVSAGSTDFQTTIAHRIGCKTSKRLLARRRSAPTMLMSRAIQTLRAGDEFRRHQIGYQIPR